MATSSVFTKVQKEDVNLHPHLESIVTAITPNIWMLWTFVRDIKTTMWALTETLELTSAT